MAIKDALLPEFDHEMATTRRVLERVPAAENDWKPHAKSMDLGNLASHIAEIPGWVTMILESPTFDMSAGPRKPRPKYASAEELLAAFDQNVAKARAAIAAKSDQEMMSIWTVTKGGQVMMSMPKGGVLRSWLMNHLIHHRGQCSVYLRLRNVPVPSIYGPTADENPFQ